MASMSSSSAAAGSRSIPVGGPFHDSILVTRLPTNMLRDELRQGVLSHFAGFGVILRYSCAMKKNETTAHIQYSSVEEAREALNNGRIMNGHSLTIKSTDKHPSTKLIPVPPRPIPTRILTPLATAPTSASAYSTAGSSLWPAPGSSVTTSSTSSVRQNPQRTLDSFFLGGQDVKERKPILEPKPTCSVNLGSNANAAPLSAPRRDGPVPGSSTGTGIGVNLPREEKPKINTCVKVELYTPPAPPSLSRSSASLPTLNTIPIPRIGGMSSSPSQAVVTQAQLRPSRSLRDIFYFDIPGMKVINNNVGPSDALACQHFTGGAGRHPFPLAMMFGRNPGSVIMPLKSIMDVIKPGMEIKFSTLELIWNGIESSVLKSMVWESAEKNFNLEKKYGPLLSDWAEGFLDDLIQPVMNDAAEEQVSLEEDTMIVCEDVQEEIIEQVLKTQLDVACVQQCQLVRTCGEIAAVNYEDIEAVAVGAAMQKSARNIFVDELCNDVIEELLEDFYLDRWIEVLASASLKKCKVENAAKHAYKSLENKVVKISVKDSAYNEFMNAFYGEVIEDLLESIHFLRIVKVVAQNSLREYKEELEKESESSDSSDTDSGSQTSGSSLETFLLSDKRSRTSAWVTSLPNSPITVESNYVSPRPSSSSLLPSNNSSLEKETSSSSPSSSSVQHPVTASCFSKSIPTTPDPSSPPTDHSETGEFSINPVQNNSRLEESRFGFGSMKRKAESFLEYIGLKRARPNDDNNDDDGDNDE